MKEVSSATKSEDLPRSTEKVNRQVSAFESLESAMLKKLNVECDSDSFVTNNSSELLKYESQMFKNRKKSTK